MSAATTTAGATLGADRPRALSGIGGRRFAVALIVTACAMAARALDWIDGVQLAGMLRDVLMLYGAANVAGRAADAAKVALVGWLDRKGSA